MRLVIVFFSIIFLGACNQTTNANGENGLQKFGNALKNMGNEMQANSDPNHACVQNQKKAIEAGLNPPSCNMHQANPQNSRCYKSANSITCHSY